MKQLIGILLFMVIVTSMTSCFNTSVQKPDKLIPKDKFVKMMVDIYLMQGVNINPLNLKDIKKDTSKIGLKNLKVINKISSTDLYYSVLKKYSVADTVFVRSLIYYSSIPKEYEKMHVQIMDILNESELQFKPKDKLNMEKK